MTPSFWQYNHPPVEAWARKAFVTRSLHEEAWERAKSAPGGIKDPAFPPGTSLAHRAMFDISEQFGFDHQHLRWLHRSLALSSPDERRQLLSSDAEQVGQANGEWVPRLSKETSKFCKTCPIIVSGARVPN